MYRKKCIVQHFNPPEKRIRNPNDGFTFGDQKEKGHNQNPHAHDPGFGYSGRRANHAVMVIFQGLSSRLVEQTGAAPSSPMWDVR